MKGKKITPAQAARIKRNRRIVSIYKDMEDGFDRATMLYQYIQERVGCSFNTVVSVLQAEGLIGTRK